MVFCRRRADASPVFEGLYVASSVARASLRLRWDIQVGSGVPATGALAVLSDRRGGHSGARADPENWLRHTLCPCEPLMDHGPKAECLAVSGGAAAGADTTPQQREISVMRNEKRSRRSWRGARRLCAWWSAVEKHLIRLVPPFGSSVNLCPVSQDQTSGFRRTLRRGSC
jgi:hypothetical protein